MEQKRIPDLCSKKENCCGCSACYATCPVGAISMVADEKGFRYPQIDEKKCIRCQKCILVCAFKKDQILYNEQKKEN